MNANQILTGAYQTPEYDENKRFQLRTYDDSFGSLWLYCETFGPVALLRANSFEDAWNILLDEIFTPIPEDEIYEAFGFYVSKPETRNPDHLWTVEYNGKIIASFATESAARAHCEAYIIEHELSLSEGYEYQPNATGSGIVFTDPSNSLLFSATPRFLAEHNITIQVEEWR